MNLAVPRCSRISASPLDMSFASFGFIPFALLFFGGWAWMRHRAGSRDLFLLISSLIFYGYLEPRYVPIFLVSGISSWLFGRLIGSNPKKSILVAGLCVDLGILIFFKYSGFLADQLTALGLHVPKHSLALPIGISFYSFMSIGYLVDIYKCRIKPEPDIKRYLAYLSLWPHLVAGPIVRPGELLPQMAHAPNPRAFDGARLIVRGLFKKLVLADNLAPGVNLAFGTAPSTDGAYWWIAAALFSLQIYFDFSGYTDIARGMARWIGYEFPLNFDCPFGARGLADLWKRWHISLSTWFRDYVYIPLGGSKQHALRNLWITFLISGVWHGAAWNFILWGLMHAAFLTVERYTRWHERIRWRPAVTLITFAIFTFAVVAFRAQSLEQALTVMGYLLRPDHYSLAGIRAIGASSLLYGLMGGAFVVLEIAWLERKPWAIKTYHRAEILALAAAVVLAIYWRGPGATFIYFQF